MRLWSLHLSLLDSKGLVALWREALGAQAALLHGGGFSNHPQMTRFYRHSDPRGILGFYLRSVFADARRRGFNFDSNRIEVEARSECLTIPVTRGQLLFELFHLLEKLKARSPDDAERVMDLVIHLGFIPFSDTFSLVEGGVEDWEKDQRANAQSRQP